MPVARMGGPKTRKKQLELGVGTPAERELATARFKRMAARRRAENAGEPDRTPEEDKEVLRAVAKVKKRKKPKV